MKRKRSTKNALISSILVLALCISMLAGATFAWFTDTASTGVNKIQAGNLDVTVEYSKDGTDDSWTSIEGTKSLFSTSLWEPGHTEFVYLRVKNAGTLGLKYKVMVTPVSENGGINVAGENFKLSDYLVFGTTDPAATCPSYTRDTARDAVGSTTGLTDVNDLTRSGEIKAGEDEEYLALVVYMPTTVGNEANAKPGTTPPSIDLGVKVVATQLEAESDSFDKTYDAGAVNDSKYAVGPAYNYFPQVMASEPVAESGATTIEAKGKLNSSDTTDTTLAKVTVPQGAVANGTTELTVKVVPTEATDTGAQTTIAAQIAAGRETANFDIKVEGIASGNTQPINVEVFVGTGLSNVKVYHNGNVISDATYNPTTGYVNFSTTSFSDFTVAYDAAVAAIGTKTYGSLENAVAAAQNGETILMLKDVTVSAPISISSGKNIVLDLNGMCIKATLSGVSGSNSIINMDNSSLEIKDNSGTGKIVSDEYGITASNGGTITVTSGTIEAGYAALSGNNTTGDMNFIINGGTLTSKQCEAIYMPGQQELTITGGTLNGGISARMGQINISGGTINGMTAGQTADSFDEYWNYSGSAWIGDAIYVWGGTYTSTNTTNGNSCNINITGGTINGNAHNAIAVYDIANNYDQEIKVSVSGNAVVNGTIVEDNSKDQNKKNVTTTWNITGGTFSSDPTAYLATGYKAEHNDDKYEVNAMDSWKNHAATTYTVDKTENTITISNAAELALFANEVNAVGSTAQSYSGWTVKLANDIDLGEYLWEPIGQTGHGQFAGTFDGNGKTIRNLNINNTDEDGNCATGLFGWLNNATVKNLNVAGAKVNGHHNVGVIAGYMETSGCAIESCTVSNATISCTSVNNDANGDKCGVIVGHAGNTGVSVKNCSATNSTVRAGRDAGQIVGAALTTNVTGCSATNVTVTANGTSTGANIRNEVIGRVLS